MQAIFWLLLASLMIFLAFNRHSKTGIYYYRSQIFADRAGYYVYLPALVIYGFDAGSFPENVDRKTGGGFSLDHETKKVFTKYLYGVSLLELPFFLVAHMLSGPLGFESDGFSLIYHWALDISAVFYALMAFALLYQVLHRRFARWISILTIVFIFTGTNLFYYVILEGSMSHVYSFFLFSAWIYLLLFWRKFVKRPVIYGILAGGVAAMIIFVRPLNFLFVLTTLFLGGDLKERFVFLSGKRQLLAAFATGCLVAVPQILYWNYLSGSWFMNTYPGESFSNWSNPQIIPFLFAPNNGLIIYNPLFLLILVGLGMMIRKKGHDGYLILSIILLVIYASASWWVWSFGCGYSARNMVEYYALLSLPLAALLKYTQSHSGKVTIYILLIFFSLYNLKMIYSYGGCWFGDGDWDWGQYLHWLTKWPA